MALLYDENRVKSPFFYHNFNKRNIFSYKNEQVTVRKYHFLHGLSIIAKSSPQELNQLVLKYYYQGLNLHPLHQQTLVLYPLLLLHKNHH